MSNRHCPTCGEEYSDTYKTCPFCEEEEAIRRGKPLRRRGGKRVEKRQNDRSGGAGGVMLLLTAVIILGVVGYVFFGEQIAGTIGIRTDADVSGAQNEELNAPGIPDESGAPAGTPDDAGQQTPETTPPSVEGENQPLQGEEPVPDVPAAPAEPLALSQPAFTIRTGETARLTASGGSGTVSWSSSNEHIATVDGGAVTGVAGGTVTITAVSGEESAVCQVTVEGEAWVNPNAANLRLNKTDFTLYAKDPDVQMKVSGTDSPVTWTSGNTAVVTVSETGVVKWVGKGNTTVTATVDGVTLECIVRAK